MVTLSLATLPRPAHAAPMVDLVEMLDVVTPQMGQPVLNPDTGLTETVAQVLSNGVVLTTQNHVIVLANTVGETITLSQYSTTQHKFVSYDYTVTKVYTNSTTHDVDSVKLFKDGSSPKVYETVSLVQNHSPIPEYNGGSGSGVVDQSPPPKAGSVQIIKAGADGGTGNPGIGVNFGFFTVEITPGNGGPGAPGPDLNFNFNGAYNSSTVNTPAIQVISQGGNGGAGGVSIGNIPAGEGGMAGPGGNVSVTVDAVIATHADNSAGVWVESRAGHGGDGGAALLFGSGGAGGGSTHGGDVYADIASGSFIHTYGNNSPGVQAESLGGAGGGGGFSIGIVGLGGDASYGGDGGDVVVHQNGTIITEGNFSYGVVAESIGGSGGDAGTSVAFVTLGDDGAAGGNGGLAAIYAGADSITITHGKYAAGLLAQSIGGGGGDGGVSVGLVTLGDTGGGGGDGGAAKIDLAQGAYVETTGNASAGIEVQSIGGGGGSAGVSVAGVALGGDGAGGGNAGRASVYSYGDIVTRGANSDGVLAQSIGGGGGTASGAFGIVALGGSSTTGGNGGTVSVALLSGGEVITHGYGSDAVVAQSIGGGGGVGAGDGGLVALGSTGGPGGNAGRVSVYNGGLIETYGAQSRGIFAESIGGGGGHGGDAGGLAAIGGSGASGGVGGDVFVSNTGQISTHGNMSSAIEVQSIGGGGGDGGNSGGVFLVIGGSGDVGGKSGDVHVADYGFLSTQGNDSDGILAQSVGGGGGNGGSAVGISIFAGVAIGGAAGGGGGGGDVYVALEPQQVNTPGGVETINPQIVTTGDRSDGVFEQSIGGGGGAGGFAVQGTIGYVAAISIALGGSGGDGGDGGAVHLTGNVSILTEGEHSDGMDVQSVGGGGGTGGFDVSVAAAGAIVIPAGAVSVGIGGSGGEGGNGGQVYLTSGGAIQTEGKFSTGLLAQSVGGGGEGGFAISGGVSGAGGVATSVAVGVGGEGAYGGFGGYVKGGVTGNVATYGEHSDGVVVQSIGGGGGAGGFTVVGGISGAGIGALGVTVGVGGAGKGGGSGGEVFAYGGGVITRGDFSTGFLAQSVGGGGGSGGFDVSGGITGAGFASGSVSVGVGGDAGQGGAGSRVEAHITGPVLTTGAFSDGVVVQSLGGGGGDGGFNVTGDITGSSAAAAAVGIGVGGNGGAGGVGGDVYGYAQAIVTMGNVSTAFLAQSVGGGGGDGGFNVSGDIAGSGSGAGVVTIGVGGDAAGGGDAGNVTGHVAGMVITYGHQSDGVVVQSMGGGGGLGGFAVSGGVAGSGGGAGAVSVGVGGAGGNGGNAGTVTAYSVSITTHGVESTGFLAQSVGGGGGAGGFAVSGAIAGSAASTGVVGIGVGGFGGNGGHGGDVYGNVVGNILTMGDLSDGAVAQSIGGGGGQGGFSVTGGITGSGGEAASVGVGVGGFGGYGGYAKDATLHIAGMVDTQGAQSDAILVQSVGGGGGDGGFNVVGDISVTGEGAGALSVGVGGAGGAGGTAGTAMTLVYGVTVNNVLIATETSGDNSRGVVTQSIGGGGGSGGFNITGGLAAAQAGSGSLDVGVGGSGGAGSSGGLVISYIVGDVLTAGNNSQGVLVQSVGGGGGSGGFDISGGVSFAGTGAGAVDVGVGGFGGGGGAGGTAYSNVIGAVQTLGDNASAVTVQSLGGGGGEGGFNVDGGVAVNVNAGGSGTLDIGVGGFGGAGGHASNVTGDLTGSILTYGDGSHGILVQSVGGGGGDGGFNVTGGLTGSSGAAGSIDVGLGGFGGAGGYAGSVIGRINGDVTTKGDDAFGVTLQSLGGGGGEGGFNVTGSVAIASTNTSGAADVDIGIGGFGGAGGDSSGVHGTIVGNVTTLGDYSHAILIQSAAGGGGDGGFNVTGGLSGSVGGGAGGVNVGLGGFGGSGGDAGAVYGFITGDVGTEGNNSFGVTVQSLGGGGGEGGFNVTSGLSVASTNTSGAASLDIGIGGFGGDGGDSAAVHGNITGNVTTLGDYSHGVLLQSAAGGGGDGGFDVTGSVSASLGGGAGGIGVGLGGFGGGGGNAAGVYSAIAGDVYTRGADSFGVTVQSLGGGGGDGGFNVTGVMALTTSSTVSAGTIGVGIGGFGGDGGYAGNVTSAMTGDITTRGDDSHGMLVQSMGGGGGDGGFDVTGSLSASKAGAGNIDVGLGGFGGGGGYGGNVIGNITGDVWTGGDNSFGVTVQSLGGGGGDGGFNVTSGMAISASTTGGAGDVGVGIGGFGGAGGNSSTVHGGVYGDVTTMGDQSHAILVQSAAGGGGDGGFNVSGGVSLSTGGAGNADFGLGGFGGGGGRAGNVYGTVVGDTWTQGDQSFGISIQSLGGGGGDGGFDVTGGLAASIGAAGDAGNFGFGIGGFGGDGGNAGAVVGSVDGNVVTHGDDSHAILIQSLGGGGGDGAFNVTGGVAAASLNSGNIDFGLGGMGGGAGNAGSVRGTVDGTIVTFGDDSFGVTIQSQGGGGGDGGFNVTGALSLTAADVDAGATANIGIGVGGFAGGGGNGGNVLGNVTGMVVTYGDDSHGVLMQSAGGGGGDGGFNITGDVALSTGANGSVNVGIGGFGGAGGDGARVIGTVTGDVGTYGDRSFGVGLESVGGGGGSGGFDVTGSLTITTSPRYSGSVGFGLGGFGGGGGSAGIVIGTVSGEVVTHGSYSDGVIAASLGGGGGIGGASIVGDFALGTGDTGTLGIGIGGFGGGGGSAGDVNLARYGNTFTNGLDSDGVTAQSIGGGGGDGGLNITGGVAATRGPNAGAAIGIGGFGGAGGNAGNVVLAVSGDVQATGSDAPYVYTAANSPLQQLLGESNPGYTRILHGSNGIVAQSIGGGGGAGGIDISGQLDLSTPNNPAAASNGFTLGIGGFGGAGGNAGEVYLSVDGYSTKLAHVTSVGDDMAGVIAQSIGGGGGDGGINVSGGLSMDGQLTIGVGGAAANGGTGGDVHASVYADISAEGRRSRGIVVQSIGGGGGLGGIDIAGGVSANTVGDQPSISFGLGGIGGAGASSGNVVVTQYGDIAVQGYDSIGVLVQSIAGGGGAGGLNVVNATNLQVAEAQGTGVAIAVGIGGSGGAGANAGDATVFSYGAILVNATDNPVVVAATPAPGAPESVFNASAAVLVQSIGGGGGAGGVNITGALAPSGTPVGISVGGSGGDGGNAGDVTVWRGYDSSTGALAAHATQIETVGNSADGVVAQSIGGGGGDGGMNTTATFSKPANALNTSAMLINVGGGGGDAGMAGNVTVHDNESIFTYGVNSTGILAQSIGGGGGNAGVNVGGGVTTVQYAFSMTTGGGTGDGGDGGAVSVVHTGDIIALSAGSFGIEAQSIGGGGGNSAFTFGGPLLAVNKVSISIGRDGGTGGTGGTVYVSSTGIIETYSTGIVAQSIGGGGGESGESSILALAAPIPGSPHTNFLMEMAVGLQGGYGATGGDVTVKSYGEIFTSGEHAQGILAQSIGGGGGEGGAITLLDPTPLAAALIGVGGSGGTGSTGGYVHVENAALIVTQGHDADGVLAQSIGGGGGYGGMVRTVQLDFGNEDKSDFQTGVSVGGAGGYGADAGKVTVTNTGTIVTHGIGAYGVGAQSIGGGGGVGGAVFNADATIGVSNMAIDVNVGGVGGHGSDGDTVTVTNNGLIETFAEDAVGVEAESIGGGGGNGGMVVVANVGFASPDKEVSIHTLNVNVGGKGGVGGTGGDVFVYNAPLTGGVQFSGDIVTHGEGAYGVLAQSIGGGGGDGANVFTLLGEVTGENSAGFSLNVGGNGGQGGDGGNVTVKNLGLIETYGDGAHGIVAQSIGGGGGNSGIAASISAQFAGLSSPGAVIQQPAITVGGGGGDGGNGGVVTVVNAGEIITNGKNTDGILAESIGGGGGNANVGLTLDPNAVSMVLSNSLSALIGGTGGGHGGTGGLVTVTQSGDITVLGAGSQAIDAESINGGGGVLAFTAEQLISLPGISFIGENEPPEPTDPLLSAAAGASQATGSSGGNVTINMTGSIGAAGADSVGLFEQSVGGGGGTLRFNVSMGAASEDTADGPVSGVGFGAALGGQNGSHNDGGDITSDQSGIILTTAANSPGALVQSIGGGGGRAILDIYAPTGSTVDAINLSLGGQDGSYESGGNITFTHAGTIETTGVLSQGEIIQSVGGGGGQASLYLHGADADQTAVNVTMGSDGGANLNGGDIDASFSGGIVTTGDHANGLFIQSVGGGGGEAQIEGAGSLNVTLGGGAGDGGDISLTNLGGIYTFGDGSNGVFLQSIGGGGGATFIGIDPPNVTLQGSGIGNGGDISFIQTGDIAVMGANATGIIAQSIGGGGGYVEGAFHGTAGGVGQGGAITLVIDGEIMALELNDTGVFAESTGSLGGGNIVVDALKDIRGGSGTGVGISIDGGADNVINVLTSLSAVSGNAITATFGNDTVNNTGLVVGDVDLGGGVNAFDNELGSTFIAFHKIALQDSSAGSSGVFTNSGEFQMGLSAPLVPIDLLNGATFGNVDSPSDPRFNLLYGARVIETVNLTGSFVQTSTGHLDFDVAFGPYPSDLVNVSGDTTVAGTGDVILTWLQDNHPVTLFATKGTATDDGLQIAPTLAIDYGIVANAIGIQLTIDTNFGQPFLTPNERRLGHHMDSALGAGGSAGIGRLLAYLGNMTSGQEKLYQQVFDQLNPEPLVAPLRAQMLEANAFGDDLFGCLSTTTTTVDKDCVWAKGGGFAERGDAMGGYWDTREIGQDVSGGWQRPIDGRWSMTAAAGYQNITDLSVNNGRGRANGQGGDLGVGFQRRSPDGWAFGFGVTGGWTSLSMARQVDVFQAGVGRSTVQTGYAQAQVNASKLYTNGKWFVRPEVQLTSTMLRTNGFQETGLAGIGVRSDGDTHFIEAAQPDLAFGRVLYDGDTQRAELTLKIGGRFSSNNDLFLPISFIGAGQGARPAFIETPYNAAAGTASVDLSIFGSGPLSVDVDYTSEFGKATSSQRGSLDFKLKF
ncbi:MAG TPA: autotransporter outer membrane beta-barrel domain-containing protein [Caulobacteraceae bacterium]|nr:autotransporter outer membrane beta-barrel domain-containing protein [Caulobacteraceae bacterium]